jgi:hypothetical protein
MWLVWGIPYSPTRWRKPSDTSNPAEFSTQTTKGEFVQC